MKYNTNHDEVIASLKKEMEELLEKSIQPIYVYLDDAHKFCNEKYAKMLGFSSAQEWAELEDLMENTIEDESQNVLVSAYDRAMKQMAGSQVEVTWKKKGGGLINTKVILVPFPVGKETVAVHFIEEI